MHLTPRADEVRLAIHTAAAQLSDPELSAALAGRWPPGQSSAMPAAWRRKMDAVSPKLARRAAMIVGASGGWNQRAKKRLAFMARVHRVSALELVRAVRPDAGTSSSKMPSSRAPFVLPLPGLPGSSGGYWLGVHGVLSAMLLLLSGLIARELIRDEAMPRGSPSAVSGVPSESVPATPPGVPGPRDRITHHAAMEQELRNTSLVATERPEDAVQRAGRVIDSFLQGWPETPSAARERIVTGLGEIAIAVSQASVSLEPWSQRLGAAIEAESPSVRIGALALVSSLTADKQVSVRARDQLVTLLSGFSPAAQDGFDAALLEAADRVAELGEDRNGAWWARWSRCVAACDTVPERTRESVILSAISRYLRVEVPAQDWRAIATALAAGVDWRAGSQARRWLLDELAEPRASTAALSVFTGVLATEVSVPGVDITMVLDPESTMRDRSELAQRYRSAWVAMRAEPTAMQQRITDSLAEVLRSSEGVSIFREQFMAVESLARLNAAAALDFEADAAGAGSLLEAAPSAPTRPVGNSAGSIGEDWARRLLNADSEEVAMAVLMEARGAEMQISAAGALVDAAMRGPSKAVRDRARLMLRARADSAPVLLAMEREVGDRPRRTLIELADDLLGTSFAEREDPPESRAGDIRAALLAAAAEKSGGVPAEAEYAQLGYSDALSKRAGLETGSHASEALVVLVERWRARGATTGVHSPESVMPRLSGMATVSTTQGQLEAAYHLALVQLMAGSMVERAGVPERDILRVMLPLRIEWSNARSAIAQMLATQRAEARLWLLLLEGSP